MTEYYSLARIKYGCEVRVVDLKQKLGPKVYISHNVIFLMQKLSIGMKIKVFNKQMISVYTNISCSFMSDVISVYYYDFVCINILVYSFGENQERCRHSPAVGVQR